MSGLRIGKDKTGNTKKKNECQMETKMRFAYKHAYIKSKHTTLIIMSVVKSSASS